MTYPRRQIAPPDEPGFYHVVSRCVRRAFLCGPDRYSGRNFDHRRQWIEDRIRFLATSFCVSVYSYAVMSNHFHIVLSVDPDQARAWSDDEVVRRWLAVFPGALRGTDNDEQKARVALTLRSNPQRLQEIRSRLGSLSWFMRALNEPIARWANKEDECSGRFWEGRFKCQALLEEQAVVSAMAYVDLNPVRAQRCDSLEGGDHTSVQLRLRQRAEQKIPRTSLRSRSLTPVAGLDAQALLGMTESSYLDLVQWTGEQIHPMKRGKLTREARSVADQPPDILRSLTGHPKQWLRQVQGTESHYYRAIGSTEALMAKAAELGQRWMKGGGSGERAWLILQTQVK